MNGTTSSGVWHPPPLLSFLPREGIFADVTEDVTIDTLELEAIQPSQHGPERGLGYQRDILSLG